MRQVERGGGPRLQSARGVRRFRVRAQPGDRSDEVRSEVEHSDGVVHVALVPADAHLAVPDDLTESMTQSVSVRDERQETASGGEERQRPNRLRERATVSEGNLGIWIELSNREKGGGASPQLGRRRAARASSQKH